MNVSASLSDAHTTFYLLARMFRVVKAGGILVPDPATEHCGQRNVRNRYAHILIQARMHANSYTETVICMRGLHNGEIRFTSTNVVFKQS